MNRKFAWLLLTGLLIIGMVLASCQAPATTTSTGTTVSGTTTPQTTPSTVPATSTATPTTGAVMVKNSLGKLEEKPQYGGVAKYTWQGPGTLGPWDPTSTVYGRTWHMAMYETLVTADITRGPSGTNEFAFGVVSYTPASFYVGNVAESWEVVDLQTIIYHLRKGVSFQAKAPANGRAVVADDFVTYFARAQADPKGYWYKPPGTAPEKMIGATAVDKSILKITWPYADARILQDSNWWAVPSEFYASTTFDKTDWHNACGTGPWIVKDYVPDSSLTYVKNPNYWGTDPFFPENKVPYVDGWVCINIPDYQTGLAALRTGQTDTGGATWEDAISLQKSNPELGYRGTLAYYNPVIEMRNDLEPFSNINFRKALAIAIDRVGIVRDLYKGNGEALTWPYFPELKNVYTPLDQLPADCQELFSYNPAKAKDLLTQAGYPQGYKIELMVPNNAPFPDLANIVKSYWDAIGVATTVNVMENGAFYGRMYGWNYNQTAMTHWSNGDPIGVFATAYYTDQTTGKPRLYNYSKVNDPYAVEVYNKIISTPDGPALDAIYKEAGPKVLAKCYNIGLPDYFSFTFWQPWLKGYAGELYGTTVHRWQDTALRVKLTGKK